MNTKDILDKLMIFIQELTAFYSELSEELPENFLRVVVDNTRGNSELKKIPRKSLTFRALRRHVQKETINQTARTAGELPLHRLPKKTYAAF